MQVELTRSELIVIATALESVIDEWSHLDNDDEEALLKRIGDLLSHDHGNKVVPTEGPDAADLWRE